MHNYCIHSPRKPKKTVTDLVQRLSDRSKVIRNSRKRERRLRGKVSDLMKRLHDQRLLTSQAEEILDAYKGERFINKFL